MRKVVPRDLVETAREGLLVIEPDLDGPVCEPLLWRHIHSHPKGYPSR
jgi:hypothetical protein